MCCTGNPKYVDPKMHNAIARLRSAVIIHFNFKRTFVSGQWWDGAWRSSLLNVTAGGGACSWGAKTGRSMCEPVPETTGTANFAFALAWGVNSGILPADEYLPAVARAWAWLSGTALHADGVVGNCQPGGGSPENNFGSNSTNDFCVGQFLLASAEVSRLAAAYK